MTGILADILDDLGNVYLSFSFELTKYVKSGRIRIPVILSILLPMLFYVIPPLFDIDFADAALSFAQTNLSFVSLLIIITGAIFVGDAVSGEFEKKTGLLLFPTPQSRTSIYIGKFAAGYFAAMCVVTLYYLITVLEIITIYGTAGVTEELLKSYILSLLYTGSVVGVMFLLSTVLKRTMTSSISGFFLFMMIMPMVSMILQVVDVDPWYMVTFQADLITDVLNVGGGFSTGPGDGPSGVTFGYSPEFDDGVMVMVAYTLVSFVASLVLAVRKKME